MKKQWVVAAGAVVLLCSLAVVGVWSGGLG